MTVRRTFRTTPGSLAVSVFALALVLALGIAVDPLAPRTSEAQSSAGRGFLGVSLQELDDRLRESYDYHGEGVLVSDVSDDSPAERVGIEEGDILMRIGDREVDGVQDATNYVRSLDPGTRVAITVFRNGNQRSLGQATIADADEAWERRAPRAPRAPRARVAPTPRVAPMPGMRAFSLGRGRLGVQTHDLGDDLGSYFKAPGNKGALVLEVLDDTPAERAGLKAGDVILRVGDQDVADSDELRRALRSREAGPVSIEILRNGTRRTLSAELSRSESFEFGPGDSDSWMGWLDQEGFGFKDGDKIKHHKFRIHPDGDGDHHVWRFDRDDDHVWHFDGDDWKGSMTDEERKRFEEKMERLHEDLRELRREVEEQRRDR
jgi:serine protease Do